MEHNITVTERKCDRCGKRLPPLSKGKSKNKPDLVINLTDLVKIKYVDLCDNCKRKAKRLFKELGKVDLKRRGRRLKKKPKRTDKDGSFKWE